MLQWGVQATLLIFFPTFWQLKIKQVSRNGSLLINLQSDQKLKNSILSIAFTCIYAHNLCAHTDIIYVCMQNMCIIYAYA